MKLKNIILVPTDFSEVCHNAIDHSLKIAELINFKVTIFHVINKETQELFKGKNVQTEVDKKLKEIVDGFKKTYKTEIDYIYEEGSIFDLIHEKAEALGANLIVLGTHGKKGIQHLMGSYALKVITKAQVPTLVVQHKSFTGYKHILLPVNSFTEARQKVSHTISVASIFKSSVHILKENVKEPAEAARINIITKQISEALYKANIAYSVETAEKSGESAIIVVEYAIEHNMDLIMILTEPQLGTSYFSLGPWNEKIIFNEAQIPVMCINPRELGHVFFDF